MNTEKLVAFAAVADERSFAAAAEELDLAESEVRDLVRELECEIGHALFDRATNAVRLTPEGEATLGPARAALAALAAVSAAAGGADRARRARVRLGLVPGTEIESLPDRLAEFASAASVTIEITTSSAASLDALVADGALDLAFIVHARPSVRLVRSFLDPLVAVGGPPAERLSVVDLASRPLVVLDPGIGSSELLERTALDAGVTLQVAARVPTPQLARELASSGMGTAVLPSRIAPAGSPRVLDGHGDELAVHVGVIARPEPRPVAVERLIEVLVGSFGID